MLIKIVQLLLSLSLLVIIHEFGHYIFARIFKCRVEKFYLFFDWKFSLFKKKIGDTEYGIGWIPLGGYVKISGMVDESMDKEQLAKPAEKWEFRSKPAWQRLFIIVGGVMMNLVLAFAIYVGVAFAWGEQYIKTEDVKSGFEFSQTAKQLGFQNGDRIVSVDGLAVENSRMLAAEIILAKDRRVLVDRGGEMVEIEVSDEQVKDMLGDSRLIEPRYPFVVAKDAGIFVAGDSLIGVDSQQMYFADEFMAAFAAHKGDSVTLEFMRSGVLISQCVPIDTAGRLGVFRTSSQIYPVTTLKYGFFEAIPRGATRAVDQLSSYWDQLGLIFSPKTEAYKGVGGFITMGSIFPDTWNWYAFWNLTALLSIMLAVINIMPIPALDGGHLVFIIYEMITRRAPSQKFMEAAQYVGFILVLGIIVLANGNDIIRLFR